MASGYTQEWSAHNSVWTATVRLFYSSSYDSATNTSTITVVPQFKCSANYGNDYRLFNGNSAQYSGVLGNGYYLYQLGTSYSSGNYLRCGEATNTFANLLPGNGSIATFAVTHDSGGNASFDLGFFCSARAMYDGSIVHDIGGVQRGITIHENAASTIASSTTNVATTGTYSLSMNRLASTNYHIATFTYNSTTLYTSEQFAASLSFTVPRTWFSAFPTATSIPVTVSVQTYTSSGTAIGSPATANVTVTADAGMKPTVSFGWCSASAYNTGAVSGMSGYIKGYSRAAIYFNSNKVSMTDAVGASIASYSVTCQGKTTEISMAGAVVTPVLTSTSVSVICIVTDTRGRSSSETINLSVIDYARPSLSGISVYRCTSSGTASEDGTYYLVQASTSYSSLNGQNSCTLTASIAAPGGSYSAETALTSGTASILGPISADTSYTVRITATDRLGNTAVYYASIPSRKWAMKFRPNGRGVAFGKAAEYDNMFQISADWSLYLGNDQITPHYLVSAVLEYDETDACFKIGDNPPPLYGEQYTFAARNRNTGSIYIVWYNAAVNGFHVGWIAGNAPTAGQTIAVQYWAK